MIRKATYLLLFSLSMLGIALLTVGIGLIDTSDNNSKVFAQDNPQKQQQTSNDTDLVIRAGPLTAVRHVFDDPTLRVWHYCTPHHNIMAVCSLFDSNQKNATLIGIEYMLTPEDYKKLPEREKPYWHYHVTEFAPNRADPHFPMLSAEDEKKVLKMIEDTYGKVILTWDPNDKLPAFPPQVPIVQHPDMVNKSSTPETHIGSYNQTLDY
jgi:Protein of unknown function (DUF1264)